MVFTTLFNQQAMLRQTLFSGFLVFALGVFVFTALPVFAQTDLSGRFFQSAARATNPAGMLIDKKPVQLWGVQNVEGMPATFELAGRITLDNALGLKKISCEVKSRGTDGVIVAQCTNEADLDLGLYMLQQGYVVVDRSTVYGSAFEIPYIQAELDARNQGLGAWSEQGGSGDDQDGQFILILGGVLLLCMLGAFSILTLNIMRGFQRVVDVQNQSILMMNKERELRQKEREIFATMLDSEIKANKSKIEAYLVVYDEMLRDLKDPERTPKYKRIGDIVQEQPILERSVFDRNAEKLDILGPQLATDVIRFYGHIKVRPDYINLEPDMAYEDAIAIVQKAYNAAHDMDQFCDRLIDLFAQGGFASEEY